MVERSLSESLLAMFQPEDLHRFAGEIVDKHDLPVIVGSTTPRQFTCEVVRILRQHGVITDQFYDRLLQERPTYESRIERVRTLWREARTVVERASTWPVAGAQGSELRGFRAQHDDKLDAARRASWDLYAMSACLVLTLAVAALGWQYDGSMTATAFGLAMSLVLLGVCYSRLDRVRAFRRELAAHARALSILEGCTRGERHDDACETARSALYSVLKKDLGIEA